MDCKYSISSNVIWKAVTLSWQAGEIANENLGSSSDVLTDRHNSQPELSSQRPVASVSSVTRGVGVKDTQRKRAVGGEDGGWG